MEIRPSEKDPFPCLKLTRTGSEEGGASVAVQPQALRIIQRMVQFSAARPRGYWPPLSGSMSKGEIALTCPAWTTRSGE